MIKVTKSDDQLIGQITISRPEKMNAINLEMRNEIGRSFLSLDEDANVKVIIVTGAGGKAFSAGGDVSEFLTTRPDQLFAWGEDLSTAERISKPVIAQLDGYTFGAGLELALSCDIRIATPKTELAFPEIKLGMVPASGGITRIVKMLGLSRASYILLLGKRIDSTEAHRWGLIHEIVENNKIDGRSQEIANELIALSPLALKALKQALRRIADSPWDAALDIERKTFGMLRYSGDFKEGVDSFLKKRKANFVGK